MIIDKLAYNSKLRKINPHLKLFLSIAVLFICIISNSFTVSAVTVLTMLFLIIFIGKTPAGKVFRLMTIPLTFVIFGTLAIAVSIEYDASSMLVYFRVGTMYIGVGTSGIILSLLTMAKCFGAVSCMYFLSLSTPMIDLFTVFRKSIIPNFIVETAELIYRYIFVLFDMAARIRTAQDARLGYSTLRLSFHSTSTLASSLFMKSFRQADKTYTAMESRGYDGNIDLLVEEKPNSPKFITFTVLYISLLVALAVFCRKIGI